MRLSVMRASRLRNYGMTEDVWDKNAKDAMSDMRMYGIMTYERKK